MSKKKLKSQEDFEIVISPRDCIYRSVGGLCDNPAHFKKGLRDMSIRCTNANCPFALKKKGKTLVCNDAAGTIAQSGY